MIAFLPCAGTGKRLILNPDNPYVPGPKELQPVAGRPMIEYSLDAIAKRGVRDVVLAIAPGKESVAKYVALSRPSLHLATVYQREPFGTGHAVGLLKPFLSSYDKVLYLMPDSVYVGMPIRIPEEDYVSVFLWPTDKPEQMGTFRWRDGFVFAHVEKKRPEWPGPYWAWGAAVLNKEFIDDCEKFKPVPDKEFTIDDVFDLWLKKRTIKAVPCDGYYVDCGTPDGIREAEYRLNWREGGFFAT